MIAETIECDDCGSLNSPELDVCALCGESLEEERAAVGVSGLVSALGIALCLTSLLFMLPLLGLLFLIRHVELTGSLYSIVAVYSAIFLAIGVLKKHHSLDFGSMRDYSASVMFDALTGDFFDTSSYHEIGFAWAVISLPPVVVVSSWRLVLHAAGAMSKR